MSRIRNRIHVAVSSYSQFSHISGDAFRQSVEVLVAAANNCLHTSALAGALRSRHTARLLVA